MVYFEKDALQQSLQESIIKIWICDIWIITWWQYLCGEIRVTAPGGSIVED